MSESTRSSKHYTINLSRVGDTRAKLEAELREDDYADSVIELYLGDAGYPRDPLAPAKLDEVGTKNDNEVMNPTLHILYDHDDTTGGYQPSGPLKQLKQDLEDQGISEQDYDEVTYGVKTGTYIPTPQQIWTHPKTSARALHHAVLASKATMGLSTSDYRALQTNTKKFLSCIRKMYGKILARLDADGSRQATEGIETSNGIYLLYTLIKSRTHTEQLATILGLLTAAKLLPSVKVGSRTAPETVKQLFKRVRRMARDAREFPVMTHPIPEPVLKVWAIHALLRSNKSKYKQFAADAMKNDLTDSWEELLKNAETAEGNRIDEIIDEYAPSASALAEVQAAEGDNDVDLHAFRKKVDSWSQSTKGKSRGTGKKSVYTRKGICYHYTRTGNCRFASKCRFKHSVKERDAYKERNATTNVAEDEDSDDARFAHTATATIASPRLEDPFSFIDNGDSDDDGPNFQ